VSPVTTAYEVVEIAASIALYISYDLIEYKPDMAIARITPTTIAPPIAERYSL